MTTNIDVQAGQGSAESTAERIVDAAERLFAEKSYEATTLREIARQVGIREPSLYAHFPNKEAIYGAVIDRALSPFLQEISRWNRQALSWQELLGIPQRMLALHQEHPCSARILHKEFCSPADRISPKVLKWYEEIAGQSEVFMSGLAEESAREGESRKVYRTRVLANSIALTNMTLGFFATQGVQARLLGDDYDPSLMFEEYGKVLSRVFRSLLL